MADGMSHPVRTVPLESPILPDDVPAQVVFPSQELPVNGLHILMMKDRPSEPKLRGFELDPLQRNERNERNERTE